MSSLKRPATNYSHCPLKKRPIKYDPVEDSDSDISYKGMPSPQSIIDSSEPENLSTKPEDLKLKQEGLSSASSSSSLSPPPISLVAGRGGSITSSPPSPISPQYNYISNYSGGYCGFPSPPPPAHPQFLSYPLRLSPTYLASTRHLKPVSGGGTPEPISFNPPAAWSKMTASVVAPTPTSPIHHNYSSAVAAGQRSSSYFFDMSAGPTSSYFPPHSSIVIPQFHSTSPSHFAPFSARSGEASGSPPHISPPLTVEPAYPVIKIEEANRDSHSFSYHQNEQNTKFYEEITTPVAAHQQHHHNFHHHEQPSSKVIIKHERHCYPSPPNSHQSAESRDSVISHSSVSSSSSNSQNQQPVATPPQLPQVTPINVNGSVRYQCSGCNKSYSTFSGLSKHIQFHCPSQTKKEYVCKFCAKVYISMGALKMHIRTHTLPCKCHLCGKAFSRPWLLQGHIRTHTGEKPFSCQHCNRAFADRSNLRAHLQTHSEVKKYSCKHCSKTFSRMSLLTKHEDTGCGGGSSSSSSHSEPTSPNSVIAQNMSKL